MKVRAYYVAAINALAKDVHASNVRRGFYDEGKVARFDGQLMNVVTEVAEAQEEWRAGRGFKETHWKLTISGNDPNAEELRQSVRVHDGRMQVRNYDYDFGDRSAEWFNLTPEVLRKMPNMIGLIQPEGIPTELADIIIRVLDLCGYYDIDIASAIADKLAYNDTRPIRHGGKRS